MKKLLYTLFALALVITACEKTIVLDQMQTEPQFVIEGLVVNVDSTQYVKISKSVDFYAEGTTPRVTNATVTVKDSEGNVFNYVHNPWGVSVYDGVYASEVTYEGIVGRRYNLTVEVDGETFTASDDLYRVTPIDSLVQEYDPEIDEEDHPERKYLVKMYAKEPQETKDYYLFKFYRNGEEVNSDGGEFYYANDDAIAENINGIEAPGYYAPDDTVTMEILSLSRLGYLFYNDANLLINSDGGMFSPPPANPRSNIEGGAAGFFQTSAIDTEKIVIKK